MAFVKHCQHQEIVIQKRLPAIQETSGIEIHKHGNRRRETCHSSTGDMNQEQEEGRLAHPDDLD